MPSSLREFLFPVAWCEAGRFGAIPLHIQSGSVRATQTFQTEAAAPLSLLMALGNLDSRSLRCLIYLRYGLFDTCTFASWDSGHAINSFSFPVSEYCS